MLKLKEKKKKAHQIVKNISQKLTFKNQMWRKLKILRQCNVKGKEGRVKGEEGERCSDWLTVSGTDYGVLGAGSRELRFAQAWPWGRSQGWWKGLRVTRRAKLLKWKWSLQKISIFHVISQILHARLNIPCYTTQRIWRWVGLRKGSRLGHETKEGKVIFNVFNSSILLLRAVYRPSYIINVSRPKYSRKNSVWSVTYI